VNLVYNWHDIFERAGWTAIQAFLGALPAGFTLADLGAWKVAGLAAIGAAVAYLISVIKNLAKQRLES
jgi:hypothetical protein